MFSEVAERDQRHEMDWRKNQPCLKSFKFKKLVSGNRSYQKLCVTHGQINQKQVFWY